MPTIRSRPGPPPPRLAMEDKDPYLIGRFRFNPKWVHKEWSNGYFRWLVIISCAVWYNLVLLFPRAVFHELQDGPHVYAFVALDYFCDIIYVLDTLMRILTGYLDNGILVTEPRKLFRRYVTSPYLKWDVLSLIPTDLLFIYTDWKAPYPFFRVNRLLRLGRVGEFKHRALTRLDSPNTFRLVYLILTMIVIVHVNACIYYYASNLAGIGMDRWAYPGRAGWRYETGHGGGGGGEGHAAGIAEHVDPGSQHSTNDTNDFSHNILAYNPNSHSSDIIATHGDAQLVNSTHDGALTASVLHSSPTNGHTGGAFGHSNAANEADLQDNAGGSVVPPRHRTRRRRDTDEFLAAAIQSRSHRSSTPAPVTVPIDTPGHFFPLPEEPTTLTGHEQHVTTVSPRPGNPHGELSNAEKSLSDRHGGSEATSSPASGHDKIESHGSETGHGSSDGALEHGVSENASLVEHGILSHGGKGHGTSTGSGQGASGGAAEGHGDKEAGEGGGGGHHKPLRLSPEFINDTLYQKYSYCMYWSVKMMTSKPYEIANPQTTGEFLFHLFDAFVGILLFASIVGEVDGIIESINKKSDDFKEHLDSVKQYISMRKVGKEMESRVVKWFDYIWSNNGSLNEESVLTVLPEKLRMEIAKHVHLDVLKKVPIFQGTDEQFLLELAEKLKFEAFCPGDYVCRRGDIGRDIYVVRRGLLNVIAADGVKVIVTLKAGVVFGELSLLNVPGSVHGNRRTVTVRSVGYADLYSLSKEDFWASLEEYPEVKSQLMEKAKKILQKDNLVNEDVAREQARRGRNFQAVADKLEEGLETVGIRMERFVQEQTEIVQRLTDKLKLLEELQDAEPDAVNALRKASDDNNNVSIG